MVNNGRKTIGVFITNVEVGFSNLICQGIIEKAKELNYNVVFFSSYGIIKDKSGHGQDELNILNIPNYNRLDGIIIAPSTYFTSKYVERLQEVLKDHNYPIVTILGKENDRYHNIAVNNKIILEDIIRHFITKHKFNRINFLAGFKGAIDSEERLESYKRVLKENNIPIEEKRIYYGDFWKDGAYDAVEEFLKSDLEMPQAIICANDVMAMAVCCALEEKGIKVPEDITVSGCDDIFGSCSFYPSITTAKIPFNEMGMKAVEIIDNTLDDIIQEKAIILNTKSIYRESCGCLKETYETSAIFRRELSTDIDNINEAIRRNASLSTYLTGIMMLEDMPSIIDKYIEKNKYFDSFYLCLREDWQHINYSIQRTDYSYDKMLLYYGIKNRKRIEKSSFLQENVLPDIVAENKPQVIYISLIHYLENYFGYAAVSYNYIDTHPPIYHPWLINISNTLEKIRISEELNKALSKLEDLYIRDPLTGLFNRRGFSILAEKYLMQSLDKNHSILVFATDIDNLKKINDKYGHNQGDIVIKETASALQKAADDDELCIRSGGDEFVVVGIEYNEAKATRFVNNFINEIENYNTSSKRPYEISASYGYILVKPDENTKLNEVLNLADKRMYNQKKKKRESNLI